MSKDVMKETYEPVITSASFIKEVRVPDQSGRFSTVSLGMVKRLKANDKGLTATGSKISIFYPWSNVADVVYASE